MKVGLITDDAMEAARLRKSMRADPQYEVIWVVPNAAQAVSRAAQEPVDIALLSIGKHAACAAEDVRSIMKHAPCPILLIAHSIDALAGPIFDALGAGAVDVLGLTDSVEDTPEADAALLGKLKVMRGLAREAASKRDKPALPAKSTNGAIKKLVLLGASAGGPTALATVLAALPRDFAAPVVIVQHLDQQFVAEMATWLGQQCSLPVHLARDNEVMKPGNVYLGSRNEHLVLRDRYHLGYEAEPQNHLYKPSIDELFFSVARFWSRGTIGVLLTGMGRDGAQGLRTLREAGALTITQDRDSSVVYGIPQAAAKINAATEILPLDKIGKRIAAAVAATHTGKAER